jgi:hypothetical protein
MKRSYSRRELYALGEPLGDSATYRKAGGLVFGDGGGGGGSAQPDKTTQVAELPEWARPYAKDTLAKGAALTDINQNPYQTYGANRIAGFSPLQERSFQGAANMQPSQQLGTGSDLATAAGIGALGTNYQAGQFTNQFQDPGQYQPGQFSMSQVGAPNLQNFQMGPAERVRTQSFTRPGSAEQYMSPYMQNVVDIQKREAQRQSGIQGTQQQAQAVGAGAFGGSRDAIMRAERERNLGQQMGDIQATGSQAAFQQAQQQFNAEQQARLQAQQANQQAGLTVGGQNLGARLGVQQLGAGQNLQSQLANQQAFQQAQSAAEQSRQYGAGQGLQAAGLGAQYGQAAQQLGEQSRQYGAGLGMQGLQTGLSAAGQLGQLGQNIYGQQMGINQLQSAYGGQMQQQAQRPLDMAYQDFLNQQNYPYKQLGFMSDMIRGLPLGQQSTSTMYEAPGSMIGQLGGLGMGALGMSSLYNSATRAADGGLMDSYAGGGDVTSQDNKDKLVNDTYSIEALMQAKEAALARRDVDTANAIDGRIAQLNAIQAQSASIDRGLGNAFNQIPEERQEEIMYGANGGIVAFADRGAVVDPNELTSEDYQFLRPEAKSNLQSALDFFTPKAALENRKKYEQGKAEKEKAKAEASAASVAASNKTDAMRNLSRATQIKTNNERVAPAPKQKTQRISPTLDKAVTKMAEEQGVPKDEFMDAFNQMRDKLQAESKEDLKGLQGLIDKQSGKSKEIKEQALGKALAEFGFNLAAQASKKGREGHGQGLAGLLGSVSAASPILAASAAESQKLAAAADENDMKLQMEMRKFNIATRKNDSATAMQHAQNMRILQQQQETIRLQQAQLAEQERANRAREGLQGQQIAARSGTAGLRVMQAVAKSKTEAAKMAIKDVEGKIKAGMTVVKPEDYDRLVNQAMKKYLPITTGFGMTGMASSEDDDDIIDLD